MSFVEQVGSIWFKITDDVTEQEKKCSLTYFTELRGAFAVLQREGLPSIEALPQSPGSPGKLQLSLYISVQGLKRACFCKAVGRKGYYT